MEHYDSATHYFRRRYLKGRSILRQARKTKIWYGRDMQNDSRTSVQTRRVHDGTLLVKGPATPNRVGL